MLINDEVVRFENDSRVLLDLIQRLSSLEADKVNESELFLAEAIIFRQFRNCERLVRSIFLNHCGDQKSPNGRVVVSKLKCNEWETAEEILKSGNRFLDWGNFETVRTLANLVFEDGFPVIDLLSPVLSHLKDMQKFRNFIAHDSREAANGFKKAREQYVSVGDKMPETVGELAFYRKNIRADITIKIIHKKVTQLGIIYLQL